MPNVNLATASAAMAPIGPWHAPAILATSAELLSSLLAAAG
ncbi:MAG: hypothetical protein ABUL64_04360 [Singulisphaera sp.]